jgi:hypothetical protein
MYSIKCFCSFLTRGIVKGLNIILQSHTKRLIFVQFIQCARLFCLFSFCFSFKRQKEGCVWNVTPQANRKFMLAGPPEAPHPPVTEAPSSHLCWPGSCGCCGLPCTGWRTLGWWSWWAGKRPGRTIRSTKYMVVGLCLYVASSVSVCLCRYVWHGASVCACLYYFVVPCLPCLGPVWSLSLEDPRHRRLAHPRRSCTLGFLSLHSWPR